MQGLQSIDLIAAAVLGVAALRGLFKGLIREFFSILALAAAVIAVRLWNEPVADSLYELSVGRISQALAPWVAGMVLGVGVLVAVGTFGAVMGRGARVLGLGWADRAGGAALGIAEGALVVAFAVAVIGAAVGREHSLLSRSHSLALLEQAERVAGLGPAEPAAVAAPPPSR